MLMWLVAAIATICTFAARDSLHSVAAVGALDFTDPASQCCRPTPPAHSLSDVLCKDNGRQHCVVDMWCAGQVIHIDSVV
jgi:hypothetical protein